MVWVAVIAGLLLLVVLISFILQNQDRVTVQYFGAVGQLSLGMALLIAAVAGGLLVSIAGAVRILQLRIQSRRPKRQERTAPGTPGKGKAPAPRPGGEPSP